MIESKQKSRETPWAALPLIAIMFCSLAASAACAQELRKLYAARPPAGSAFVRVVGADTKAQIGAVELPIGQKDIATRYVIVPASKPMSIAIDGKLREVDFDPQPGKFYTLAVDQNTGSAKVIDEGLGDSNDLKAQLRFFNLASGCESSLQIVDGPVVFDRVQAGNFRSRAINPVQAKLRTDCEGRAATFELPPLRSGDHYSLFFRRIQGIVTLAGQFDETEPYREP